MLKRSVRSGFSAAALAFALAFSAIIVTAQPGAEAAQQNPSGQPITTIPETLDKNCRNGRAKLYDECSDQMQLFARAAKRAAAENKVLLVSYGAEWCIWCHVFGKYIEGQTSRFDYLVGFPDAPDDRENVTLFERAERDVRAEAAALNAFVAGAFVVLHIDSQHAPGSGDVLRRTGAAAHLENWIPFIFTVDRNGKYAAQFEHEAAEVRRDTEDPYRGYNRPKLLAELNRMQAAASR